MDEQAPVLLLLGQVEVLSSNGSDAGVSPGKQRAILAYLALRGERATSTRQIVDAVWAQPAPSTATAMVHTAIGRIRAALAGHITLETTPAGYVLHVDPGLVDVGVVRRRREQAMTAAKAGRPASAATMLRAALDTWRGDSLADLIDEPFADQARRDLDRLRGQLELEWAENCVSAGVQIDDVIAVLAANVVHDPLDERAQALLIRSLSRAGRRAEALAQFDIARRCLAAELGVSPGSELLTLHTQLLRDDQRDTSPGQQLPSGSREAEPDPAPRIRRRRRRRMSVAATVILVALAVAVALTTHSGHPAPASLSKSSTPRTTVEGTTLPAAPIAETLSLPQPSCCAVAAEAVWGAGHHDDQLYRFSGTDDRTVKKWPVLGSQSGLPIAAAGSIWIPAASGVLVRFDTTSQQVVARIHVGGGAQVTFGFLHIWETTRDHRLLEIDLATNRVVATVRYSTGANDWDDPIATGPGAVWVSDPDANTLVRIDPLTNKVTARIRGFGTTDSSMPLAYGAGSVWVKKMDGDKELLFQVDPATNRIVHTVDVAASGASGLSGSVTVGAGFVWTGNWDNTLSQIDPANDHLVRRYALPALPQNLQYGDGALWIDSYDNNTAWKISVP